MTTIANIVASRTGWRCPCGAGVSPDHSTCPACSPMQTAPVWPSLPCPYEPFPIPPAVQPWWPGGTWVGPSVSGVTFTVTPPVASDTFLINRNVNACGAVRS